MEKRNEKGEFDRLLGLVVYSPVVHLVIFIVSYFVHLAYPIEIVRSSLLLPIGLLLIFVAPILIAWSQSAVEAIRRELGAPQLRRGPYRFSRNPTYGGLALLTFGFSFIVNSLPLLIGSILAFIVVNAFIVPREERLMHEKYGEEYAVYRSKVRRWL